MFEQYAGMDRHIIDALPGMLFNHVQHVLGGQVGDLVDVQHRLVDRHRSDGHLGLGDDRFTGGIEIRAGGQVHHGVRPVAHCQPELFELLLNVRCNGGVADVGVDLHRGHLADSHGFELPSEVVDVGR